MVMMRTAMGELISELAFLKFHPSHQSQLFEHRQGAVDGNEIHGGLSPCERRVNI